MKPTRTPNQSPATAFTRFYRCQERPEPKADANGRRLGALMKMFNLSPSAVARAGGVSPAYVSRILNESDPFVGSIGFYRRVEAMLGQLVEQRQSQFFRVPPVNVRSVEGAVRVMELAA